MNILAPAQCALPVWPKCSFFGVYDGHGGERCSDYLRDHLHQLVIRDATFPANPKQALINGCKEADRKIFGMFGSTAKPKEALGHTSSTGSLAKMERSGSCAAVVLIVGDMCYVANVGDSRVIMSGGKG